METQKVLRSQNNFEKEEQSGRDYALCNQNNVTSNQDSMLLEQNQTHRLRKWIEAPEIDPCTYGQRKQEHTVERDSLLNK